MRYIIDADDGQTCVIGDCGFFLTTVILTWILASNSHITLLVLYNIEMLERKKIKCT